MTISIGDIVTFRVRDHRVVGYVYGRDEGALDVMGVDCKVPPRHPPQAHRWRVPVANVTVQRADSRWWQNLCHVTAVRDNPVLVACHNHGMTAEGAIEHLAHAYAKQTEQLNEAISLKPTMFVLLRPPAGDEDEPYIDATYAAYDNFIADAAKECVCCASCCDVPCGGCTAGGVCDAMACTCTSLDDDDLSDAGFEDDEEDFYA